MKVIDTKKSNINNNRVFKEIDDFMMEVFGSLGMYWSAPEHRDQMVDMIDMWMEQWALESGKIIQYDVRCSQTTDTQVLFVIDYRQKNCFNTSTIEYTIEF